MAESKRRIWGWMLYDWATQPYATLGLTFVFGPYFAAIATQYFMEIGLPEATADARAQSLWSLGQTLGGLAIALIGPVAGAYADLTGQRMRWISTFSVLYVVGATALWFAYPDGSTLYLSLIAFTLGYMAMEFTLIFTNAILPSLGTDREVGRISGSGAALGYWGGVLSLFLMLIFFAEGETGRTLAGLEPIWGLDAETREGTRFVGPFIAVWYVIFMIPFFLWVPDDKRDRRQSTWGAAVREVIATIKAIAKRRSLGAFLLGSMFYRDALNALYGFGGVYATLVLDWSITMVGIFGIIAAIVAAIATWIGGLADQRFGPKPVIVACILALMAVCTVIVGMTREELFGIALRQDIPTPAGLGALIGEFLGTADVIFYICGAVIGGAGGALYSASRSMMVRHTNPEKPTEAFGLFALSGKATAFLAPALIGLVTYLTDSARIGVSPVIGLFLIGLVLLRWVNKTGDRAA